MHVPSGICIGVAALCVCTSEVRAESWRHELTAMVWASGLEGRESLGPIGVDVDTSFSDLIEFVDVGGAMRFTAQRDSVTWFIEASYVELSDETVVLAAPTRAEFSQTIAEGGLMFDIADQFALYGGARYQMLDLEISNPLLRVIRRETDWVDAIAGFRWTPLDAESFGAWLRADIGAGGSDFQWLAEAGVAWRFASAWSTQLAYRVLDVDYESGGFGYDMRQSGLVLGLTVSF